MKLGLGNTFSVIISVVERNITGSAVLIIIYRPHTLMVDWNGYIPRKPGLLVKTRDVSSRELKTECCTVFKIRVDLGNSSFWSVFSLYTGGCYYHTFGQ